MENPPKQSATKAPKEPIVLKLVPIAKPHSWLLFTSVFFMILSGFANIFPSWLVKASVDGINALEKGLDSFALFPTQIENFVVNNSNSAIQSLKAYMYYDTSKLLQTLPLIIVSVFALDAIFKFIYLFLVRLWGVKIVRDLREKFHNHINLLSFDSQRKFEQGSFVSVVTSDLHSLQSWLSESMVSIFNDSFKALFLFIWLLVLNYKLTFLAIVTIPVFAIPVIKIGKRIRNYSRSGQDYMAKLSGFINESVTNQKIIKAYNLEGWRNQKFISESKILYKLQANWFLFMSMVSPITNVVAAIAISSILFFGLKFVSSGYLTLGEFSSFFITSILLYDPVKRLGRVTATIQSALGVSEKVFELLEEPIQDPGASETNYSQAAQFEKDKARTGCGISFKDICFSYAATKNNTEFQNALFDKLNLNIPAKSSLALVGPSGSGKSSVMNLLLRFYQPDSGTININDVSIHNLPLDFYRKQIALVNQDPLLFTGTIRENIMLGSIDQSPDENQIRKALKMAYLDDFVEKQELGLDTHIGEMGNNLSLGQKQRLSIARAFLSEAPIVILDEPTSALDNQSQEYVYKSIQELMKERTVIIIAHRLNTIRSCDQIVYLEDGAIVEVGNYEELSSRETAFSRLLEAS